MGNQYEELAEFCQNILEGHVFHPAHSGVWRHGDGGPAHACFLMSFSHTIDNKRIVTM